MITNLDFTFAEIVPQSIHKIAKDINSKGGLIIPPDQNTWKACWFRCKHKRKTIKHVKDALQVGVMNMFYWLLINFQVVFFNYFIPIVGVLMQFVQFYQKINSEKANLSEVI